MASLLERLEKGLFKKYEYVVLTLTESKSTTLLAEDFYSFIDIDFNNTNADISKINVSLDNMPPIPLNKVVGIVSLFKRIDLSWDNSQIGKRLGLILGRGIYFRLILSEDLIGLAKDSTVLGIRDLLTPPTSLRSAKVTYSNTGSTDMLRPLFYNDTFSKYASIYRDKNDTGVIYVGDFNSQVFPLNPGDVIKTRLNNLKYIILRIPPNTTANIYVLYEV